MTGRQSRVDTFSIILVVTIYLILPAIFIYGLWRGKFEYKLEWLIQLLAKTFFIVWLFLAGPWDWFSYYLRYLWLLLLIMAAWQSARRVWVLPWRIPRSFSPIFSTAIYGVLAVVFGAYLVMVLGSFSIKDEGLDVAFPLKDGTYYVGQGGNHVQMNYHHAYRPQQYALDIVKLNRLGARASGFYPKELERYAIYGDPLYSPCDAEIVEVRDGLPDLNPPDRDPDYPEGNYVALRCEETEPLIYIAHMQQGSIEVKEGMKVKEGEKIGAVGNSGNTTEPHLHIHAELNGIGVPLTFHGRFLVRNSLVR